MKMTIESTDMITEIAGVSCRIWRGVTEEGIRCDLAIPLIRVREEADRSEFEAELRSLPAPRDATVVSMRQVW
jgi:hypothetical protein